LAADVGRLCEHLEQARQDKNNSNMLRNTNTILKLVVTKPNCLQEDKEAELDQQFADVDQKREDLEMREDDLVDKSNALKQRESELTLWHKKPGRKSKKSGKSSISLPSGEVSWRVISAD